MRHIGPAGSRDDLLAEALPRFHDTRPGFGHWIAELRATGEFVGWFGLRPWFGDPTEYEVGYRLARAFWGRGLATEGCLAIIEKAFADPAARRIVAQTMAVNLASRRVMEKAGLRYVRTFHLEWDDPLPGSEEGEVEYALTREEWAALSGA
jgi:RimJ/RimL family protein N-acetyltransferase